ncbi:hypothetical protein BSKO_03112 [Bryopsis sp. KO-2023]|nr:hypothetical protein BSKO_03112 [Bryopsis sp. KO-2023]
MVYVLSPDITQSQMDFWTDTADRLIQTAQPSTKGLSFSSFCVKTVDNESQAAARQDIALVAGAVIVLIFVCCGMLFRFHQVESRASLAAAGVLCVVLSMVMGFGFCMGIGVPFTPMQQLAPFILLGIGVDDMFILVRGMDEAKFQNPTASLEFLFRRTMETSGVSITITSITNLVAFMLGALSSLPAVRWFCMYSGVSIFCDYLLQISFFMGVMVLNERRMRSGKMDLMPWIRKSEPEKQPADTGVDRAPEGYVSWFIDKYYAPFILNPWTRRFLLVAFLAIAGGGIYAGMNLKLGLNVSGLTRKGSKAQEYLKIRENDYLEQTAGPLGMYFLNIDVSDPEIQQKMLLSWEIAKQDGRYLSGPDSPQHNWLTKLIDFAKAHEDSKNILTKFGFVRQDRFYSILEEMLEVLVNKIWMQDMKFDEMGMISSSRFGLMQRPLGGVSSKQEMIDGASAVTRAIEQDVFHEEGDGILKREVLVNVSLAGAGVVLVNLVLLIHPLAALLMVSAVVLVELGLVLVMWFVGVHLHIVTLLLVIMALGLGVDYPVHILHRFLTIDGESSTRRAHRALVNVGPAVGIGFVTTLSGFILLAGTKSELFGTLFVMLVTTVCLAFAVGTLYIPAMMVMTNLPPLLSEVENYETADRSLDDIEASRG